MRRGEEIGRKTRNIKRNHVSLIEIKIGDKKRIGKLRIVKNRNDSENWSYTVLQENLINPIIVILIEICVHIEYNKLYIKYFFFIKEK